MSGDVHVRFCESVRVRVPRATHHNIYVRSQAAGERVMKSVSQFLTKKLKLRVNQDKSAVAPVYERKFLGFRLLTQGVLTIAPKSLERVRERIRQLTRRNRVGSWRPSFGSSMNS
jgi:hypothetical protein